MTAATDDREQTLIRLTPEIKRRLRDDAKRNRRSMSAHLEHLIDLHTPPLDGDATAAAS